VEHLAHLAHLAPPDHDRAPGATTEAQLARLLPAADEIWRLLGERSSSEAELLESAARVLATALDGSAVIWRREPGGRHLRVVTCFDPDPTRRTVLGGTLAGHHPSAAEGILAGALEPGGSASLAISDFELLGGFSDEATPPGDLVGVLGDTDLLLLPIACHYSAPGVLGVSSAGATGRDRRDEPASLGDPGGVLLEQVAAAVALGLDSRRLLRAAGEAIEQKRRAERNAQAVADLVARTAALDAAGDVLLFACDGDGIVTSIAGDLGESIGLDGNEAVGRLLADLADGSTPLQALLGRLAAGERLSKVPFQIADRRFEISGGPLTSSDETVVGFTGLVADVSSRRRRARRDDPAILVSSARQEAIADLGQWALVGIDFADLLEDALDLVCAQLDVDTAHVFEALPEADFLTLTCCRGASIAGNELLSAGATASPASFALASQETVVSDDVALDGRFEVPDLWVRTKAVSVVEVPVPGQDGPVGVLGAGRPKAGRFGDDDIAFLKAVANVLAGAAARHRAERTIRAQALQDPLTGLPNRLLLADHGVRFAGPADPAARMSGEGRSVLVFDIDRFKEINDTLGHGIGDLVLLEVSRRLRAIGHPVELVARLGGDEFALIARGLGGHDAEARLAHHVLSSLGEPLDVGGVHLRLRGSIGIASADVGADGAPLDVPSLLRRAEVALYQAKSEHQGVRRYSDDLERSSLSRLALASELTEAIERSQLVLDYQPKVLARSGHVTGVEALVRWHHPTRGVLNPDVFVPLAEQTGVIRELTSWVLARALAECASWHRSGWPIPVAVNLSAGTVHDPALLDAVLGATARSGLPTSAIELEVTESAVMRDPEGAMRSLSDLAERGVHVALDDFGTGYSSLAYLQRLPVKSVKIDKSFVKPLASDDVARAIVRAVVDLGHSLHLSVIAEGVDSAAVLDAVQRLGCDAVQGFHVATPMNPQVLQQWMGAKSGVPRASAIGWPSRPANEQETPRPRPPIA
jgi:diguanylate cyclase (GGDEF)-like protein